MTIFDWIGQIQVSKKSWDSFTEVEQKTFNSFIINRWLSMDYDYIEIVNQFQKYAIGLLSTREVYKWYCSVFPKQKKFNKYIKGKKHSKYESWVVDIICKEFECSKSEANDYLGILYMSKDNKSKLKYIIEKYGVEPKLIKKLKLGV